MRRTFAIIRAFFYIFLLCGGFWIFYHFNTNQLYGEYSNLWNYRRLHPEFQSDEKTIRLIDAGHDTTYADTLWINLIQYIADNIQGQKFTEFTTPLLDTVAKLHPHFTRTYTLALLLSPSLDPESDSYEKDREMAEYTLSLGERGMLENCDQKKIQQIQSGGIALMPWEKPELQNPCIDGNIPYYAAYVADSLGEREKSSNYYTIASANKDAPEASRFLAVLEQGKGGNRLDAALQFFFIASSGYDESPYFCQKEAVQLLTLVKRNTILDESIIQKLQETEKLIKVPEDTKNPLAKSTTNCYDSINRGIKQMYLEYITEKSKNFPNIKDGASLVQEKIVPSIPVPLTHSGFTVRRETDGSWEYRTNY